MDAELSLYIPNIGDVIQVRKPWSFLLLPDDKNVKLGELHGYSLGRTYKGSQWVSNKNIADRKPFLPITLEVGTKLQADRIEARKNASAPPAITFYAVPPKSKKKYKFWVLLIEANKLVFTDITEN